MARINIVAIHKIAESSLEGKIIADYLKRIPWKVTVQQLELKDKFPPERLKIYEGELLLKAVPAGSFVIALDERGLQFTSHDFYGLIEKQTQPISFIIGGAYGLSDELKSRVNLLVSLSAMTMPHALARVVLVEQIYRSFTISQNHPYHK